MEFLPFIFITLRFLSFLTFQTVVQTKGSFITAFLMAGHYLITTSGSHMLFKVPDGRRRNGETYNTWEVGKGWAAARADSQVPCSDLWHWRLCGKGGDDVIPPRHILGGRVLQNQQQQMKYNCHLSR